jgi:hypothetical protein
VALRVRSKVLNAVLVWFVFLRVMAPCSMEGVTSVLYEHEDNFFLRKVGNHPQDYTACNLEAHSPSMLYFESFKSYVVYVENIWTQERGSEGECIKICNMI